MELLKKLYKSRTVWTLVFLLVWNIIPEVKDLLPPGIHNLITVGLTTVATYFKINPSQTY